MIFCFHSKKTAAEYHRLLLSIYAEAALSKGTCREWFQRLKSGDFNLEDRHVGGKQKIFEDSELEALLAEDTYQRKEKLAESLEVTQQAMLKRPKAMRMLPKQGN